MCGIVGYVGTQTVKDILLKGLEKLEYRGYDSAGLAVIDENVNVIKEKGRIATLREKAEATDADGTIGIGHTRWATHGVPNITNAHPHQGNEKRFTLVHNGVIENYEELKAEFLSDVTLTSDTDTEIIVQMIEKFADAGATPEEAFRQVLSKLEGSYAIAMLDANDADTIYVGKNKSPLLVGLADDANVVASDSMAMLHVTKTFVELMDEETVIVNREGVQIKKLDGTTVDREPFTAELDESDTEKGTYAHYMLKEIDEQPFVIRNIIQQYQDEQNEIKLSKDIRKALEMQIASILLQQERATMQVSSEKNSWRRFLEFQLKFTSQVSSCTTNHCCQRSHCSSSFHKVEKQRIAAAFSSM